MDYIQWKENENEGEKCSYQQNTNGCYFYVKRNWYRNYVEANNFVIVFDNSIFNVFN